MNIVFIVNIVNSIFRCNKLLLMSDLKTIIRVKFKLVFTICLKLPEKIYRNNV